MQPFLLMRPLRTARTLRSVPSTGIRVALVGLDPSVERKVGLGSWEAALVGAGHVPVVVPAGPAFEVETSVEHTLAARPKLVVVALNELSIAPQLLAFVRLLRQGEYQGHVSAAGVLAASMRSEFLSRHRGFDSVIWRSSEDTLLELAGVLQDSSPDQVCDMSAGICGLMTRSPRDVVDGCSPG